MPSIKQTLKARVQEQRKVLAQMRRDQSHPQSYRSEVIHSHQGHGGDHCRHDSLMDYKHEQSDHDVLYGNDRTHSGQTDIDRVGLKHPGNNDHDDGNNNGDDTDSGDDKSDSNSDDEDEDEDSVDDSILIMRVTMDHGVEEIKVPKNPNPAQLAFDFCQKHGLSPNKIALMESYIVQNINVVEDSTPSDDDPSDSDGDDTSDDNDSKGLDSQVDDHEMYRGGDKYEEGDAAIERHQLHQLGLLASAGESSSSAHGIDSTNTNSIMRNNFLTNAGQDDENSGDRDHYLATETRVFDDDRDGDEDEEDEHETRVLFPRDRLAWTSPSKREIKMMVRRSEAISKAFQELRVNQQQDHQQDRPENVPQINPHSAYLAQMKKGRGSVFQRLNDDAKTRVSVNQLRQSQREAELELQALQLQEREIQINKNKTASSSEIGDRLYEAGLSVKQSKSRFIRKSLRAREEELKKITFTPQITAFAEQLPENNSKKIVLERLNTPIKPSQKFLEVRKEVQHERVKECTFVPKISINSQKIAAFQARQHTRRWKCEPHLRLYKQAVQRHEQKRRRESEKKFEDDMHVNQFKLELMRLKELEKKKAVKKKKRRERQKRLRRYASQYSVGDYIHAGLDADELAYDYGYGYQRYSRDDETPFGLPMGKGDAGDGGNIKNHENDKGKNKGQDQDDSGNNNNGNNNNNGASNNDRVNHHPTHITHASENGGGDENKYDDRSVAHSRSSFLSQPATVYQQSKLKTNLANTSTVSNSTSPAHEHTTPSLAASIQSSSSSTKQRDLLATHTSKDTTASAPSPPPTHHHTPPQYPDIVQKQLRQYQQQHQRQHTLASPSTTPSTGSVSSSTTPAYPRSHSHSSDHTPSSDTNVTRANSVNGSSVSDAPVTGSAEDLQRQVAMYQEQLIALQQQLEDKEKKEGRPGEKSRKKTRGGGGKGARKGNCSVSSEKGAGDGGRRAVKKKRRRRKKKKKHSFLDRVKSDISRKKTRMKRTVRKHTKGHYHVDPSTGAEVFHPFFTPQISAGSTALLDSKKYNTKAVYSDQPRGGETPAMEKKKRQLKRESKQRAGNYPYAQHSREIIDNLKTQRFREIFMLLGGAKGYLSQTCLLELNRLSANQLQFVRPLLQTHHRGQIEKARAAVTHHMQKRRRQKDRDRAAQRGSEGTSNRYDNGDLFGKGSGSGSENSEDSDASDVFDEEGVDWFVSLEEFCNMLDAELVRQRSAHGATHLMLLKQRQSKRAAAKVKAKEAEKRKKEKQRELQEMQEQLQRAQQYTQPVEERTAGYARASYRHESGDIENSEESGQESRTEEEEDEDAEYNSDEDVENQTETYSFHPTLNYQSRVLADNHRLKERERNVPLHDILYHESHLLRQKKETRHTQKMQQELSKLSFQPNLHRKSRSRV